MGMALAYSHPIGALNNERQRRVDRTNRIQNNDYKSSIKRPALICFKKKLRQCNLFDFEKYHNPRII